MEPLVFLNGSVLTKSKAKISPFDLGFLYGYSVFETMRSYSGRIFRLEQHLRRLENAARTLHIPLGDHELKRACYEVLEANKLTNARIRLSLSAGEAEGIPDQPNQVTPTVFISVNQFTPVDDALYSRGCKAMVSSYRQNSRSPLSTMKTANYLNSWLARQEARSSGASEALLLNEKGFISEGSMTNIFLLSNGALLTPDIGSGCLPGITRGAVIELASAIGITAIEREIVIDELFQAEEAFLTNSILEILPLSEVDGICIGSKKKQISEITDQLSQAYKSLVKKETSAEF